MIYALYSFGVFLMPAILVSCWRPRLFRAALPGLVLWMVVEPLWYIIGTEGWRYDERAGSFDILGLYPGDLLMMAGVYLSSAMVLLLLGARK